MLDNICSTLQPHAFRPITSRDAKRRGQKYTFKPAFGRRQLRYRSTRAIDQRARNRSTLAGARSIRHLKSQRAMSSARKGNYAPKRGAGDSFEELSAKLTADLRNHVRFMVRGHRYTNRYVERSSGRGADVLWSRRRTTRCSRTTGSSWRSRSGGSATSRRWCAPTASALGPTDPLRTIVAHTLLVLEGVGAHTAQAARRDAVGVRRDRAAVSDTSPP